MSQQPPPQQRPQRPQAPQQGQYPPQQGYQQQPQGQYPPQQGQYPQQPQYPPQQGYQQAPAPMPQRGGNPILTGLKWLFWPFLKIGGWILGLFNVIIHEVLRSTVRLIFSIAIFALVIALLVAYIMALVQTNFDFAAAVSQMFQNIMGLFGL